MMVLSTTTALAQDFSGGSLSGQGWTTTGVWIGDEITSGLMVEDSGTISHAVKTNASGAFTADIQSKYGDVVSRTVVGVKTADGKVASIEYDPATVSYYANGNGERKLLGHDWSTPYTDHHQYISSTDGKTYTFRVGSFSTDILVGSVPTEIFVEFYNNGASTEYDQASDLAKTGAYHCPTLYTLAWSSPESVPVASIVGPSEITKQAPYDATFQGEATNLPDAYQWTVNDVAVGTEDKLTYKFDTPGIYTVTFTASNGAGSGSATVKVTVESAPPGKPVANIVADPMIGTAPLTVEFQGSATEGATTFTWALNGETIGTGDKLTYTFSNPGSYDVQLVASNGVETSDAQTVTITVKDPEAAAPAGGHIIDPAQAVAFCQYPIYSPDAVITYDGNGGYTVSDPRQANPTTQANPAAGTITYTLAGQVVGAADNQPIADASIVVGDSLQKTNANGEFAFTGLEAGNYDLAVSADGFVAKTQAVDLQADKLVSLKLDTVSASTAISASAANETANMTMNNTTMTTTDSSMAAGSSNATATPGTARSPGFEVVAVLAAVLMVAGTMFYVRRKNE